MASFPGAPINSIGPAVLDHPGAQLEFSSSFAGSGPPKTLNSTRFGENVTSLTRAVPWTDSNARSGSDARNTCSDS